MQLLSSFRLGSLELPNRVVMAPMTRSRAVDNLPNALMAQYYAQRASAGLIVTEGIAPSPNGLGYARIPGLYSEAQVEGFRAVTEAVHARGGRIIAQLMHVGRVAHPLNMPAGARVVAPSRVAAAGAMYTDAKGPMPHPEPEEMSAEDLRSTREEFVLAARHAIAAGFDGIELHGANGYLLEQFLHPHTNRRGDAYGGGPEQRNRYVIEVARAAADAIGAERVAIRLSPYNPFNDLPPAQGVHEQYVALARALRGLLYVHLVGTADPEAARTSDAIKSAFAGPLISNGGYDRESGERALAERRADLIAYGRPYIANPDLVERFQRDLPLATPDAASFYTPGASGYVDYAPAAAA